MIVLDEQLRRRSLVLAISQWYPGTVVDILALRPDTLIKDDNIATLLHAAQRPIFVTINVDDFWRKINAHVGYCVIGIAIQQQEWPKVSDILRQLLSIPQLKTRADRMGKVILVRESGILYYEQNGQVQELE